MASLHSDMFLVLDNASDLPWDHQLLPGAIPTTCGARVPSATGPFRSLFGPAHRHNPHLPDSVDYGTPAVPTAMVSSPTVEIEDVEQPTRDLLLARIAFFLRRRPVSCGNTLLQVTDKELMIETRLIGRYLVDRELGSGGMGEVQEADAGWLTSDLCTRLLSLLSPDQLARVDIAHIDQLAARVLSENAGPGSCRRRIDDVQALGVLRQVLAKIGDQRWADDFLLEEWDQVVLGQSLSTRKEYFDTRRAGRGRSLTRPERNQVWKLPEQFTARLDRDAVETWGQVAERAARDEATRAAAITENGEHGGESSGTRYRHHRYIVAATRARDTLRISWHGKPRPYLPGQSA